MDVIVCNGRTADDPASGAGRALRALALRNYGHFTTMQVRGRAVRGLDLHLRRLRGATRELFDATLDEARVLDGLRRALAAAGVDDCSARVTVCAPDFEPAAPQRVVDVDVLVSIAPPAAPDTAPLRAKSFRYERALPQVKHVGTFPLFHHMRAARRAGFDDALFATADGRVSEGSVWNVGFWDGRTLAWPDAPALRGTCERLLQAGLAGLGVAQATRGVRLADLAGFRAAFGCNSRGIRPVGAIDEVVFAADPGLMGLLTRALERHVPQPL